MKAVIHLEDIKVEALVRKRKINKKLIINNNGKIEEDLHHHHLVNLEEWKKQKKDILLKVHLENLIKGKV